MKEYSIKLLDNQTQQIDLDDELSKITQQAEKDYQTSKTYIDAHEKYIWRSGYKSYHLSTYDRKVVL